MSKLLLLVAFAGVAAVIAQAPAIALEETVVPETDEFDQDKSTGPEESDVHKASACTVGDTCTFEIMLSVQGGTSNTNEELFELNRELNNVKYTVQVTPEAHVGSHSKLWEVQGLDLLSVKSEHSEAAERTDEFKNCKVSLLQGERTGHVHAILQDQNEECPAELLQMLVASVSSLTPVKGHSTKAEFHHDETRGEDQARTMYKTDAVNGASTVVKGVTHHRFHNEEDLMANQESAHMRDSLHRYKSHSTTTIVDNSVHHHHIETKVRMAPAKQVHGPSSGTNHEMPESLYGGSQRYTQKDMSSLISHTVQKIKTAKAPTSVPSMKDMSVDQFLQHSQQLGKIVTMLKDSVVPQPEKVNPFTLLNEAQQAHYFDKLVQSIPETPKDLASAKVSSMMQVKPAHKIFMHHLKQGKTFKLRASAMLVGGLARARPLPTDNLLSIANNEKLPDYTREQAMWGLLQSECSHNHHMHAISALELTANSGSRATLGLHTTAKQLQHLLGSEAVRCSQGKAADAIKGLLDSTEESLLQNLAATNWNAANMDLVALGNSRFERHSQVVQKVLEHPSLPDALSERARHVASLLPGKLAAELVQRVHSTIEEIAVSSNKAENDWGFSYDWDTKFPPDGKNGAPNPKFQAIPKAEVGVNKDDGVYGAGYVEVKLWDDAHTYTALKLKVNVGFSGKDKFKPVTTLSTINDKELYTTATKSDDDWEKDEDADPDVTGVQSTENLGYCGTDVNSFKGFKLSFELDHDIITAPPIKFWIGPFPLAIKFKLKGLLAFEAGAGFLGGTTPSCADVKVGGSDWYDKDGPTYDCAWYAVDNRCTQYGWPYQREGHTASTACCACKGGGAQSNMLTMYGVHDAKLESSDVKCGGGSAFSDGGLVYLMPTGSINVDANAGIDCGIIEAGIGLDVKIYEAKLPVTLELNIGGTSGANCIGVKLNSESGSGRMYLYFDSWFSERKEWDLFEWTGAQWSYPPGKQMLGKCSSKCNLPEQQAPQFPDPTDTDCIVGFYKGRYYGGPNAYKYFLQSKSQGGKKVMLPRDIADNVESVKTFGNCDSVELMDDDGGVYPGNSDNGWIFDVGGRPYLPYDLEDDIQGVVIKALPPHIGQPKPTSDWHKCCVAIAYIHGDFVGKEQVMKTCYGSGHFNHEDRDVESIELSPGCDRVRAEDDDWSTEYQTYHWSRSSLDNDFENDIKEFVLYDRAELELVEDVKNNSVNEHTTSVWTAPDADEAKNVVKNGPNGCWTCTPDPGKAPNECFESADKKNPTEAELAVCKGAKHHIDKNCHCNDRRKHSQEVHAARLKKEYKELCNFCGFYKVSTEEKTECQEHCHKQPVSVNACSEQCMI